MIRSLALILVLILGITGTVFLIQKATQLNSKAFSVLDFVYSFHAATGDPRYNPNLDVNGDGIINSLDVLRDRYAQEATKAGQVATNSGQLNNIIGDLQQEEASDEASSSADNEI